MEQSFIYDFFIKPIITPEMQGYNLVNTSIYIVLLVLACIGIYQILKKKIEFNSKFFVSLSPYILFGISMRVIMHQIENGSLIIHGITKTANPFEIGFWFFTPGIWLLTFALVIIGLVLAETLKKGAKTNYKKLFLFGAIISLPLLLFNLSRFNNWIPFIATLLIIIVIAYGLCWLINKYTNYKILNDQLNLFIVTGQAIDGIASSIAVTFFNFSEQHVFSNMLINIHPALFAAVKILLAVLLAWSLDDYLKEEKKKNTKANSAKFEQKQSLIGFIKIIIAILGFATGLASLFKLGII